MIQLIIGLFLLFVFFSFLFVIAWYVAIPLLLILFAVAIIGRIWEKIKIWMPNKAPVEKLERVDSLRRRTHKKEVIDVDYTEV